MRITLRPCAERDLFRNRKRWSLPGSWLAVPLVCLVVGVPAAHAGGADCPPRVRLAYTDAPLPPYVLGQGETIAEPPGLFIKWARAALVKTGCLHAATTLFVAKDAPTAEWDGIGGERLA